MEHKKEIKVMDPRLRAIRNNLREIIYLRWDQEGLQLIQAQSHLLDAHLSQEEKLLIHLQLEENFKQNRNLMKNSIIMCGWCHQRDKDAIYNPSNRQWFCPDCYNEHEEEIINKTSIVY